MSVGVEHRFTTMSQAPKIEFNQWESSPFEDLGPASADVPRIWPTSKILHSVCPAWVFMILSTALGGKQNADYPWGKGKFKPAPIHSPCLLGGKDRCGAGDGGVHLHRSLQAPKWQVSSLKTRCLLTLKIIYSRSECIYHSDLLGMVLKHFTNSRCELWARLISVLGQFALGKLSQQTLLHLLLFQSHSSFASLMKWNGIFKNM